MFVLPRALARGREPPGPATRTSACHHAQLDESALRHPRASQRYSANRSRTLLAKPAQQRGVDTALTEVDPLAYAVEKQSPADHEPALVACGDRCAQ